MNKDYRKYKKQLKGYRKDLCRFIKKEFQPYDYGFFLVICKKVFLAMEDYYSRGNNIMGQELPNHDRKEICTKLVELLGQIDDINSFGMEEEKLKEFTKYLGEELLFLWD